MELKVGRVYRAKKPACVGYGYYNDRQIVWVGQFEVQYDSPSVADGRHYPSVPIEKFRQWAARDITDQLPAGEWARWGT